MTLVLSAVTRTHAVQVSDRRTTLRNGEVHEDEFNKAISLGCVDGHLCLSMTGLAWINNRRTMDWLAHQIVEGGQRDFSMKTLVLKIQDRLSDAFTKSYYLQGLTIVGVGSVVIGRTYPLIVRISNFEPAERFRNEVSREFKITLKGLLVDQKVQYVASGCGTAIRGQTNVALWGALRQLTGTDKAEDLMRAFVRVVRMASDDAKVGPRIGKSCMGQVVPHGRNDFEYVYFPSDGGEIQRSPIVVAPPGIVADPIRSWSGDPEAMPDEIRRWLEEARGDQAFE